MRDRTETIIRVLALLGIVLALYSLSLHYDNGGASLCDFNDTFNCDKVNRSPWSEFLGVPVALLGALAYLALFLAVQLRGPLQRALAFTDRDYAGYVTLLAAGMLGFQVYLTMIEMFVIHAYCAVCLMSQALTILVTVLAASRWQSSQR